MHYLESSTIIGNQEFQAFIYGYGTSVTKWDYVTWWRSSPWAEDGYADRATYTHERTGKNGNYAQRINIDQHTTGRKGISQGDITGTAGKPYAVSVWLRQVGLTTPVTVYVGPNSGDGPSYAPYASASITGVTGTWTRYQVTLTPNTTNNRGKLFIGTAGTGSLWIDMVGVMPTDPSEVVYGGWRPDFVNAVDVLKPVSIRWPGGIIADSYYWENGIGSRDTRPPMYYAQWDALWMTNDVGTHEILDLAQQMGLVVMLNINWGQSTTTDAANWVEYVNGANSTTQGARRVVNGRSTPWGVKTWEIGNEVWGGWTPGHTDATTYANSYVQFRDAMAVKDATIEFVGEGGDGNSSDQSWNATMVQTAGGKLDQLAVHYYSPQPLPQNYDTAAVYQASVGSAVTIGDRLAATGETVMANTSTDMKLAVLEHQAMYFNEEHRRTRSLEAGLFEAGMLNLLMRRADLNEVNAASALMNFWDGSSVRIGNRGTFVTPGYHVQKLVGNNHGPLLIRTAVTTDTYTAPAMGNLPSRSGVPVLDVTTTRSADGTKTYISVLNRDPAAAAATTINLSNAGIITGTASVQTVNSPNYLDANSWQNPTLVQPVTTSITAGASFTYSFPAHSYTVITVTTGASAVTLPAVTGRVTTAAGTAIAGATVTLSGGLTGTTNANGYFLIPNTPVGMYSVTTSKTGFSTKTRTKLEVSSTGATTLPIRL